MCMWLPERGEDAETKHRHACMHAAWKDTNIRKCMCMWGHNLTVTCTCMIILACIGSDGTVTFVNVPVRNTTSRRYSLRIIGITEDGVRTVIRRSVRVGEAFLLILYIMILNQCPLVQKVYSTSVHYYSAAACRCVFRLWGWHDELRS